jgi:hypothetical protein
MAESGYPLDDETLVKLKKVLLPREPPDHEWKLGDRLIVATVQKYLALSSTLEEFIEKLGLDAKETQDDLLRMVLMVVKVKAEDYLDVLNENR